jgi:LysM repeat protein
MKRYSKIVVLLALVLLVSLTACERAASQPPVVTPTGGAGEVPFPVNTSDPVSVFATQTAVASTPLPVLPTGTPEVLVSTNTPEAAQPQGGTDAQAATPTADANAGGGVVQPAVPTPVVERPTTYTLKRGEWPICIARRYDLDLGSFFSANGMNMNSKPAAGTSLKIPASGNWSTSNYGSRSLKAHPVDYTVVSGDTVYSIACQYGDVTPEAILAVNNLTEAGITAGVKIRIP